MAAGLVTAQAQRRVPVREGSPGTLSGGSGHRAEGMHPWMVFMSHCCSQQNLVGIHIHPSTINRTTDYPELEETHKNH